MTSFDDLLLSLLEVDFVSDLRESVFFFTLSADLREDETDFESFDGSTFLADFFSSTAFLSFFLSLCASTGLRLFLELEEFDTFVSPDLDLPSDFVSFFELDLGLSFRRFEEWELADPLEELWRLRRFSALRGDLLLRFEFDCF